MEKVEWMAVLLEWLPAVFSLCFGLCSFFARPLFFRVLAVAAPFSVGLIETMFAHAARFYGIDDGPIVDLINRQGSWLIISALQIAMLWVILKVTVFKTRRGEGLPEVI